MSSEREDTLTRLTVALDTNQPLPRDLADWLADGFRRFIFGGPGTTLCGALGLAKTKDKQRAERDYWLCVASDIITFNPQLSTWRRAQKLAIHVDTFQRLMWPAIEDERQAPEGLRESYKALYLARKAIGGAPLFTSRHTLYRILRRRLPESR